MVIWNVDTMPENGRHDEECNQYYLVRLEWRRPVLAMYIEGEWWTSYSSKLMADVTGWTEI